MLEFDYDLKQAIERAAKDPRNADPLKQQGIDDAMAALAASGAQLRGRRIHTVELSNGVVIRDIPMNLDFPLGEALKQWKVYRNDMKAKDLSTISGIGESRLSGIQTTRNGIMISDPELQGIAAGLEIPPGVLATRRTPVDLFRGLHFSQEEERRRTPGLPIRWELTYGQAFVQWGKFFGLTDEEIMFNFGMDNRFKKLASGETKIPNNLEFMARKMQEQHNLPPGVIYTRAIPEDVVIR